MRFWVAEGGEEGKYVKFKSRDEAVKYAGEGGQRKLVVSDRGLECRILNFECEWEVRIRSDNEERKATRI